MDELSELLSHISMHTQLDVRCQLSGDFDLPHAQTEINMAPFHLVLHGTCRIQLAQGQSITCQAGDMVILPHGAAHTVLSEPCGVCYPLHLQQAALPVRSSLAPPQTSPDADILCGHFIFASHRAKVLLASLPHIMHLPLTTGTARQYLNTLVALMRDEGDSQAPGQHAIMNALSHALFAMSLRVYCQQNTATSGILAALSHPRLGKSLQAMLHNPAYAWTIEQLAAQSAMSRATYARLFADLMLQSPIAWLTTLRMQLAADLITTAPPLPIAQISEQCGYASESAFNHAFKRAFAASPAQWRKQHASPNMPVQTSP